MPARYYEVIPGPIRRRPQLALAIMLAVVASCLVVGLFAAGAFSPTTQPQPPITGQVSDTWTIEQLQTAIGRNEVAAIGVPAASDSDPAGLTAKTTDGKTVKVTTDESPAQALAALKTLGDGRLFTSGAWDALNAQGSTAAAGATSSSGFPGSLLTIVLWVVILGALVFLMLRFSGRQMGRRDTSAKFQTILPRSDANPGAPNGDTRDPKSGGVRRPDRLVRLEDVAGCDEAKLELTETIEFLKTPERFRKLGATIPRGIMLYGPPGTGKTMLAKAVASEADVPFHYASGSEFVEKYVGVGARRMRDLFGQAKKLGRGVIFVDEFDALGKARGGANSHEEREQTLNQLLVEMDGFSSTDDIVVIAATNRIDILDQAVLRPGRFTRKIHVGLPDVVGRKAILEVHSRNKPFEENVDLEGVARKTYGFSGAQLADLMNEAAIFAARASKDAIGNDELHQGWLKVAVGTGRKRSMDERERSIIAAHEVGHAICGRVHGDKRTVEEISLFAHGEALGVTVSSQEDNDLPSESDLRARLIALMGGRAAEELLFREVTAGASNDFEKANYIATQMVTRWGMGSDPDATDEGKSGRGALSLFVARNGGGLPSEVQAAATRAVRSILDDAYDSACSTLLSNMEKLRAISSFLVEHERVDGETFAALFDGTLAVVDATREWRPASAQPREWEEIAQYVERRRNRAAWPAELERRNRPADAVPPAVPAPAPVDVPVAAAAAASQGSARQVGGGRTFRRRVRSLAHDVLRRADSWLGSDGERDTASPRG